MSYRAPDNSNATFELYAAELEILRLQEENQKLKALLRTELGRPPFKPKAELPELLNASLLHEPNPFYRAYRSICCLRGDHRWLSMLDLELAKKAWRKWKKNPKRSDVWTYNPIYYFCKIQCRDCKVVGKESKIQDEAESYNRLGFTSHHNLSNVARELVSDVENYFNEIDSK